MSIDDDTRVILHDDEENDYINATYITVRIKYTFGEYNISNMEIYLIN